MLFAFVRDHCNNSSSQVGDVNTRYLHNFASIKCTSVNVRPDGHRLLRAIDEQCLQFAALYHSAFDTVDMSSGFLPAGDIEVRTKVPQITDHLDTFSRSIPHGFVQPFSVPWVGGKVLALSFG